MPLSVDWPNKFITIPKSELTLIDGTRYKITVDYWWQLLREMNASEEGIVFDTMYNSTAATSSTPQIVDLINGYTASFEDGAYSVEFVNGNTNWREVEVKNQVGVGTNNTTGFIDPVFLEASLFNNVVTIDVINGFSGTNKTPDGGVIGTVQTPSNNMADSHTIAVYRGLSTFNVIGDLDVDSAIPDVSGHSFLGSGKDRTTITIAADAVVEDCAYYHAEITGTLDGDSRLSECLIRNLSYIKGYIEQCVLAPGVIALAGTEEAHFLGCYSGQPGTGTPTIDMGGSGQALAIRDYNGGITLRNKTGPESVSIDLNSGQIKMEDTVANGTIVCRGVGKLIDAVTGEGIPSGDWNGATIINELIGENVRELHQAHYNKRVWDKNNNTVTVYDADGVTPLHVFDTNSDLSSMEAQ